jgi:hypothetical protein
MYYKSIIILLVALLGTPALAETSICTKEDTRFVADVLHNLTSWPAIYKHYKKYVPQCDDGFMAEGYSDAVVVQLAKRWGSLHELASLTQQDSKFLLFVLKHIDPTTDLNELEHVRLNAERDCPKPHKQLCSSIGAAAMAALKFVEQNK